MPHADASSEQDRKLNGVTKTVRSPSDGSNPETIHMLVLETDDPHPETLERKGSFGEIFNSLFNQAGRKYEPQLAVKTSLHYVVDDPKNGKHGRVLKLSEIPDSTKSIIITGSMYDAHSDEPWVLEMLELLRDVWSQRPEILLSGVCFGHQIISRLLGGKVEPSSTGEWELAHTPMKLTPIGQKLFKTSDSTLHLHQMHQDHVTTAPSPQTTDLLKSGEKVHVWGSTEHTAIQGLYIQNRIFTSQGHLGFDEKMVQRQIEMRQESGGIEDAEQANDAKETAHIKHDGLVVAGAILRFFHGGDAEVD